MKVLFIKLEKFSYKKFLKNFLEISEIFVDREKIFAIIKSVTVTNIERRTYGIKV